MPSKKDVKATLRYQQKQLTQSKFIRPVQAKPVKPPVAKDSKESS